MAELTPEDAEALGLDDDDLEALEAIELPEIDEITLTDTERAALEWADEAHHGALERAAHLGLDELRYLSEPSPDPMTDGLEHETGGEDLTRRSDAEPQPDRPFRPTGADLIELIDLQDLGVRAAVTGGVRIPGYVWKPFTAREVSSTALVGPRAIIEHTMGVGTMLGSWNYHNASGKPYAHGYRDGIGNGVQAQGADRRAAATLEGNPYVIAFENEDYGRWFPDGGTTCGTIPPFRAEQLRKIAVDDAWLCKRFGIPAVLMPDSCAATRGIGYHRLGIYPWRRAGCLAYSNANYKCCPDVARIAQMPAIVREIARLVAGVPVPVPVPTQEEPEMMIVTNPAGHSLLVLGGEGTIGMTGTDRDAYVDEGKVPHVHVSADGWARWDRLPRLDTVTAARLADDEQGDTPPDA